MHFSYTLTLNVKFFPFSNEKWCLSLYRFFFHFLFGSSCLLTYWKFKYFSFMTSVFISFDGFYAEWIVFSVSQRASLSSQDYKNILCIFLVFLYIFSLCYLTIRNILLVWHAFKILTFFSKWMAIYFLKNLLSPRFSLCWSTISIFHIYLSIHPPRVILYINIYFIAFSQFSFQSYITLIILA